MGDITANISQHELDCPCPDCSVTIDARSKVIQVVQSIGDHFKKVYNGKLSIVINSAARCYAYNRTEHIGSNDNSQHPRCTAIDFKILIDGVQIPPDQIHNYICAKFPTSLGAGVYNTFNHVDTRDYYARWDIR